VQASYDVNLSLRNWAQWCSHQVRIPANDAAKRHRQEVDMRALIVQKNEDLGGLWQRHLERLEVDVTHVRSASRALNLVQTQPFDVIVLDLVLAEGSALAIADLVQFRQPDTNVVFVTDTTFFSDGSIFRHAANARALVKTATPPQDLAAIVYHYGATAHDHEAPQNPVRD